MYMVGLMVSIVWGARTMTLHAGSITGQGSRREIVKIHAKAIPAMSSEKHKQVKRNGSHSQNKLL